MTSVKTYLLLFTLVIIALSCYASEKINKNSSINVAESLVNAWFDLMPGPSPGKFHLQGEIKVATTKSADIENLNLKSITIYSNEEAIYNFKPYFNPVVKDDDYSIYTGISKEFIFGTKSGMKIDSGIEEKNVIDVKLDFTFGDVNFMYEIKDVEIMRVY